jgi:hypothetical protein
VKDIRARAYRIVIYRDDADTVGLDVSGMVSEDGLIWQESPVEHEAPPSCTAEFTLVANSVGISLVDLDPDTSTYIRPGARVYFQYKNYAGSWVDLPRGTRQVIAFATADRPDSTDPDEPPKLRSVEIKCQQTLKQQQWIESAFDPQYNKKPYLGVYSTLDDLASGICQAKDLVFSPQPGDPTPAISYNDRVYYDPRTADSAIAFVHKLAALNPNTSGKEYGLWQDNSERVRWYETTLTTTQPQSNLLFDARWELYGEDLISYKPINQTRQQMPGILRVSAIARYAEAKTNPLTSFTRNDDQTLEAYDYNNWVFAERFIKTTTRVPASQVKEGATGTVTLDRTEITKEYDLFNNRLVSRVTARRFGPQHLADESGSLDIIELTRKIEDYSWNYDGSLNHIRTQFFAIPKLVQGEAEAGQELAIAPASKSIAAHDSGGGFEYSKYRSTAHNLQRQSDLYAYAPVSNANTPDSRPPNAEIQEEPFLDVRKPIFQDRELRYNGVAISKRVKTVPVDAMVFNGARLGQLADNLSYREAGSYSQYEIKFALTDAIAATWTRPGMACAVYDQLTAKTKVFGLFGGCTIAFGNDSLEVLCNGEFLGTVEDGTLITVAEVGRVTLDGEARTTLDNQARVV